MGNGQKTTQRKNKMNINKKTTASASTISADAKVNRVMIVDCSGSMSSALSDIRPQLKNKIPQIINLGDTLTIIWFSSKGECGVLQEGLEINSVTDFKGLNAAIDKFLRPVCLTGFKDPLDEAYRISVSLKKKYPGSVTQMIFMTDGADNQWSQNEIIKATTRLADTIDSAIFVEYGWYCNRSLMTKMAESIGASLIFSQNFDQYDGLFVKNVSKPLKSTKKKVIDLGDSKLDFAFAKKGDEIISFAVENGQITVPDDVTEVYYFVPSAGGAADEDGKYTAAYTLAQRMMGQEVLDILGELGDVYLIDKFNNCFSKQDYTEFQAEVLAAVNDPSKRFLSGKKANYVPAADAPTIIDLLDELASDPENKVHPYDPAFKYERISAARANAGDTLSEDEKNALMEQLKNASSVEDAKKISEMIAQLGEKKISLKFVPDEANGGYSIGSLTFNEDRPNISIMMRISGTVELPDNQFPSLPKKFPTFIFRNYAMVKDGIKHSALNNLPIELSAKSFDVLKGYGVVDAFESHVPGKIYYLNASLPVVNRKMASNVSAEDFFSKVVRLQSLKSAQKVLNTFRKASFEKTSEGYVLHYGEDAAAWLKEIGLTEFNGFSPKTVSVEPTDQYTAKEFSVGIEKCSSIPTVNDKLLDKIKTGAKLTLAESLCAPAVKSYTTLLESPVYKGAADQKAILKTWLESESKAATGSVRELIREIAKIKFAIMVGHVWFKEFSSLDENSMTVTVDGQAFNCKAELVDTIIKI